MNARRIGFWIATALVAIPNALAAVGYLTGAMNEAFTHLEFPLWFAKVLGTWKILGAVALFSPVFAPWVDRVKDFAYAGFFFTLTSAGIAHLAVGDGLAGAAAPWSMILFLVASFALRPTPGG